MAEPGSEPAKDNPERLPVFAIDGFNGTLDRLLALARTQQIDLGRLSFVTLIDQLAIALQQSSAITPLGEKGDWLVMAAWLVQLRSLLMLPAHTPARQHAEAEGHQLRRHLVERQQTQALAAWLAGRPQLGHDVFLRGQPAMSGLPVDASPGASSGSDAPQLDIVEFLWASLMLFDDDLQGADTTARYRPPWLGLYGVPEARQRILRSFTEVPDERPLESLLPPRSGTHTPAALWRRSAWSSLLVASLELEKQGVAVLQQAAAFQPIRIAPKSPPQG